MNKRQKSNDPHKEKRQDPFVAEKTSTDEFGEKESCNSMNHDKNKSDEAEYELTATEFLKWFH